MSTIGKRCLLLLFFASGVGCTVSDVDRPPLTGPSEMALRLAMSVTPDSILGDGGSQAVLNIEATGPDGRPVRGLSLRVEQVESGVSYDFGTLSAKTVVTGDDGRTRVVFTAPRVNTETVVTFLVTPIGNDYRGEIPRTVDLRVVPPGVIQPPNAAPVPVISFSPGSPNVLQTVVFDASQSTDEGVVCGPSCTYQWDFGDGSTATGIFASHQYTAVGQYIVRLTVTDQRGSSGQTATTVTVGQGPAPTGSFTFSPASPAINEQVFFNASSVQPAPGRRIVSYEWNFGNGRTGSGVTTSTSYSVVGTYPVTLTVTDDSGSTQTFGPISVTVSATGALTAQLTVSPSSGFAGSTNFFFDASASRPGPNPIVEYRFNFGDTSPEVVGTSPNATHRYLTPGTYTARVTIRDSAGRTATQTVGVNVQ
jgi:PKD repeat protein